MPAENDPDAYVSPSNTILVYVLEENWDIIRRCFGDQALREALAYRRNLAAQYSTAIIISIRFISSTYLLELWSKAHNGSNYFLHTI